jgi:hypothetical protein
MKAAPTHPRKPHRSPNRNHAKAAPHNGSNVEITAASVAETSRIAMSYTHHIQIWVKCGRLVKMTLCSFTYILHCFNLKGPRVCVYIGHRQFVQTPNKYRTDSIRSV